VTELRHKEIISRFYDVQKLFNISWKWKECTTVI